MSVQLLPALEVQLIPTHTDLAASVAIMCETAGRPCGKPHPAAFVELNRR